jgi:hypothetical protein
VLDAAFLLRIGEFDLFRLAFRRWFGREADEKALEKVFVNYLFARKVPPWVRHFCRQVVADAQAGRLDCDAFGARAVRRREPLVDYPARFVALVMVGLFLAYLLIQHFIE